MNDNKVDNYWDLDKLSQYCLPPGQMTLTKYIKNAIQMSNPGMSGAQREYGLRCTFWNDSVITPMNITIFVRWYQ